MNIPPEKLVAFKGMLTHMIADHVPEDVINEATEKFKSQYSEQSPSNGDLGPGHGMGDLKMAEQAASAPQPYQQPDYLKAQLSGTQPGAWQALKPVAQVAGDVANLPSGAANAAIQGVQDNWGHPLNAIGGVIGNEAKNLASPFHTFENPIQSSETSLERMGVDNTPQRPPIQYPGEQWPGGNDAPIPGLATQAGIVADQALPLVTGEAAGSVLSKIPSVVSKAGDAAGFLNKQAGKLASELSGVPEEALRAYGDPIQRAKMAENFGKQKEIGADLLNHIDNPDKFLLEKQAVDAGLQKMGPINVQSAIDAMEAAKPKAIQGMGYAPHESGGIKKIDEYINYLRGGALPEDLTQPTNGAGGMLDGAKMELNAPDYRSVRTKLDAKIDYTTDEGSIVDKSLSAGRTTMKNELLQKAAESGDPGYADAMKSWSDKLDKLDQLKSILGINATTRDKRVESFVSNLFGKNSTYKQQLMSDLDGIFNTDIVGRAKSANLAKSLGEDGVPAPMPRQVTGAALKAGMLSHFVPGLGTVVAASTASPRLAASFTLPMLTKLEEGLKSAGVALTPKATAAMEALKKPGTSIQQARVAAILAAELESQMPPNAIPFRKKGGEAVLNNQVIAQ